MSYNNNLIEILIEEIHERFCPDELKLESDMDYCNENADCKFCWKKALGWDE